VTRTRPVASPGQTVVDGVVEHPGQKLGPRQARCPGDGVVLLARAGFVRFPGSSRNHRRPQPGVGSVDSVEADDVDPALGDQGGKAGHEVQGLEDQSGRAASRCCT